MWNDANSLATFTSFEKFSFVTTWKQMEKFQLLIFTAQINKMYEGKKKQIEKNKRFAKWIKKNA